MRAITVYLTIVLTLALAHCQWSQDRHLSRQVRPAELIGKWTMTQQSVGDLRAAGLKANVDPLQHTITINADGTCYFHTFPSAAAAGGHITPAVEGPCRWRLLQDAEDQSLLINMRLPRRWQRVTSFLRTMVPWCFGRSPTILIPGAMSNTRRTDARR